MPHFDCDKIQYEGTSSKSPLAFKHYNPDEIVGGKSMKDHLRFAAPYWHVMRNERGDPFGAGTALMPWDDGSASVEIALTRVDVFFEFLDKMGIEYYCFHARDMCPEAGSVEETNSWMDAVADKLEEGQKATGVKLLWGTCNLFSHRRYMNGGPTNPDPAVVAMAAAQVKKCLELTHRLGGENFVMWGGRDGYQCLLNTDMEAEASGYAAFLRATSRH